MRGHPRGLHRRRARGCAGRQRLGHGRRIHGRGHQPVPRAHPGARCVDHVRQRAHLRRRPLRRRQRRRHRAAAHHHRGQHGHQPQRHAEHPGGHAHRSHPAAGARRDSAGHRVADGQHLPAGAVPGRVDGGRSAARHRLRHRHDRPGRGPIPGRPAGAYVRRVWPQDLRPAHGSHRMVAQPRAGRARLADAAMGFRRRRGRPRRRQHHRCGQRVRRHHQPGRGRRRQPGLHLHRRRCGDQRRFPRGRARRAVQRHGRFRHALRRPVGGQCGRLHRAGVGPDGGHAGRQHRRGAGRRGLRRTLQRRARPHGRAHQVGRERDRPVHQRRLRGRRWPRAVGRHQPAVDQQPRPGAQPRAHPRRADARESGDPLRRATARVAAAGGRPRDRHQCRVRLDGQGVPRHRLAVER